MPLIPQDPNAGGMPPGMPMPPGMDPSMGGGGMPPGMGAPPLPGADTPAGQALPLIAALAPQQAQEQHALAVQQAQTMMQMLADALGNPAGAAAQSAPFGQPDPMAAAASGGAPTDPSQTGGYQ